MITADDIVTLGPASLRVLPAANSLRVIQEYFCRPMQIRDLCPGTCPKCSPRISYILSNLPQTERIYILLRYRCRVEVAFYADHCREKAPIEPKRDAYGFPVPERDGFQALARSVDEELRTRKLFGSAPASA